MWVGGRDYFLVCFLDEYSRYIVHHDLLWGMDVPAVSVSAEAALWTLPVDAEARLLQTPAIRSDSRVPQDGWSGAAGLSSLFKGLNITHRRVRCGSPETAESPYRMSPRRVWRPSVRPLVRSGDRTAARSTAAQRTHALPRKCPPHAPKATISATTWSVVRSRANLRRQMWKQACWMSGQRVATPSVTAVTR